MQQQQHEKAAALIDAAGALIDAHKAGQHGDAGYCAADLLFKIRKLDTMGDIDALADLVKWLAGVA